MIKFKRVKVTEVLFHGRHAITPPTKRELSKRSGVSKNTLSLSDRGMTVDVNLSTLVAIMNALGLPASTPLSDLVEFETLTASDMCEFCEGGCACMRDAMVDVL